MNSLKISFIWLHEKLIQKSLFFNLLEKLSKKKIIICKPQDADLIIFGCYPSLSFKLLNKIKNDKNIFKENNFQKFLINKVFDLLYKRNYKAKTIFYVTEPVDIDYIPADYVVSYHMGIDRKNHLMSNGFIDGCDWSKDGLYRTTDSNDHSILYGRFYDLNELLVPQGEKFLKKKNVCLFSSHLFFPRNLFYKTFKNNFKLDCYGKYKTAEINFIKTKKPKYDIIKNYSMCLCPENFLATPGFFDGRVAESFLAKALPITWANNSIDQYFNPNSFINLNDHFHDNFISLMQNLKDNNYLKKFTKEPLLQKKPEINDHFLFVEGILSSI
jgi:hypothetical protein